MKDQRRSPTDVPISAIGSLPHHNVDAALEYSFQFDIPFFPQIPARNPQEFMLSQALHGLPGLVTDHEGAVTIDLSAWAAQRRDFEALLRDAELDSEFASCWKPFLWELVEHQAPIAKAQIAGPLTCQWASKLSDGHPVSSRAEISSQILKLLTLRAESMLQSMLRTGAQPLFYIDEPALFALDTRNPTHALALNDLKILIGALRKQGATVGLHCCSNTDWKAVLGLGLNIISLDTRLSLEGLLKHKGELRQYLDEGHRLSLGIISTTKPATEPKSETNQLIQRLLSEFSDPAAVEKIFSRCIITPACGLALKTPQECEDIYAALRASQTEILSFLSR